MIPGALNNVMLGNIEEAASSDERLFVYGSYYGRGTNPEMEQPFLYYSDDGVNFSEITVHASGEHFSIVDMTALANGDLLLLCRRTSYPNATVGNQGWSYIYKSTDDGLSWTKIWSDESTTEGLWKKPTRIVQTDDDVLWTIMRTTSGVDRLHSSSDGVTWTAQGVDVGFAATAYGEAKCLAFFGGKFCVAAKTTGDNSYVRTEDYPLAGAWTNRVTVSTTDLDAFAIEVPGNGYAYCLRKNSSSQIGVIYSSNGTSWTGGMTFGSSGHSSFTAWGDALAYSDPLGYLCAGYSNANFVKSADNGATSTSVNFASTTPGQATAFEFAFDNLYIARQSITTSPRQISIMKSATLVAADEDLVDTLVAPQTNSIDQAFRTYGMKKILI